MHHPAHTIRLRYSALTHQGHLRNNNQDHVHLWAGEHSVLAMVADGMGGAAAGEDASRIAVESIFASFATTDHPSPDDYEAMHESEIGYLMSHAILNANENILAETQRSPEMRGMGTTLTMVFVRDIYATFAHVGDSRAYLVDSTGHIEQMTSDHTLVQALVDAGHISPEEAEEHPMRNVLYRALGQGNDLDVDIIEGTYVRAGDRLILCSDGLTLHVEPDEIAGIAISTNDPDEITHRCLQLALDRGGRDNISVVAICVDPRTDYMVDDEDTQEAEVQTDILEPEEDTLPLNSPTYHRDTKTEVHSIDRYSKQRHFGGCSSSSCGEGQDNYDVW